MIGVAPIGAVTAAGTDGVGEATTVGIVFSSALTSSMNATFVFFDEVAEAISSVSEKNGAVTFDGASTSSAATTGVDTTPVATISGSVVEVGVTTVDGGTSSPVRTSLLVLGSTMRKALDLALRDAPELTGTCCGCSGRLSKRSVKFLI
jgi:hypothetical protein